MVTTSPQQFCVRWNSYQSNLQNAFPKLLTSEHFVDVTLACENEMLKCHKVVLSACSTYFEKLLLQNPCQHPIIFMKDMKFAEMQSLVDFMYKGEVNVTQDDLPSLLRSAEALQIRGLCGSDQLLNNQHQSPSAVTNSNSSGNKTGSQLQHHHQVKQAVTAAIQSTPTNGSLDKMTTLANAAAQHQNSQHHHHQQQQQKVVPEPIPTHVQDLNNSARTQSNQADKKQQSPDIKQEPDNQRQSHAIDNSRSNSGSMSDGDDASNDAVDEGRLHINMKEQTDGDPDGDESYYDGDGADMDSFMDDDGQLTGAQYHNHRDDDDLKASPDFAIANVSCQYASDGADGVDPEYDNLSGLIGGGNIGGAPNSASNRRIRRSDEELRRAAECITRGQTFQTVSDQFNIPISTIRFYMARKGILPRRKRGRACAGQMGTPPTALTSPSQMAAAAAAFHTLSHQTGNASPPIGPPYHIVHYKLPQLGVSKLK